MSKIIPDASFLIALLDQDDFWHSKAVSLRDALIEANHELIFLDCIANETLTVLGRRCERKKTREDFHSLVQKFEDLISYDELNWSYLNVKNHYKDILETMKQHTG